MKSSKLQAFILTIFHYYCLPGTGDRDSTVLTLDSVGDSYLIFSFYFFLKLCCVYPERAEREEGSNITCVCTSDEQVMCAEQQQSREIKTKQLFIFLDVYFYFYQLVENEDGSYIHSTSTH